MLPSVGRPETVADVVVSGGLVVECVAAKSGSDPQPVLETPVPADQVNVTLEPPSSDPSVGLVTAALATPRSNKFDVAAVKESPLDRVAVRLTPVSFLS